MERDFRTLDTPRLPPPCPPTLGLGVHVDGGKGEVGATRALVSDSENQVGGWHHDSRVQDSFMRTDSTETPGFRRSGSSPG